MEEVGKILPAVFKRRVHLGEQTLVEVLAPLWPRVAGKPIAQHSRPVAFEAGTLTLVTDCPSWAAQLRLMAEEIRAEINSFLGRPIVKKLRVRRGATLESPKLAARQQESPANFQASTLDQTASRLELDPDVARIVHCSFTKYFARNTRGMH